MSEWWTYHLSDFLMFSRRTYLRLFELYNRDVWPAQIVALALGIVILVRLLRTRSMDRLVAVVLAAAWCWVAWVFLAHHFSTISTGGGWFALVFAVQGLLLLGMGVPRLLAARAARSAQSALREPGLWVFVFALFVEPLVGHWLGRGWSQLEIFGLTPDPTVIGTMGCLLLVEGGGRWVLLVVPLLWCAITGATLWAMHSSEALVAPLAATLVLVVAARQKAPRRPASG